MAVIREPAFCCSVCGRKFAASRASGYRCDQCFDRDERRRLDVIDGLIVVGPRRTTTKACGDSCEPACREEMVSVEIVQLAERLVQLDREAGEIRARLLKLLANGSDPAPRPSGPGRKPGAARAAMTEQAETAIVELLKGQAMGPAEIARATGARTGTVNDRLRRLCKKGLVERADAGWRAISPP
jgi:hypothetical protein